MAHHEHQYITGQDMKLQPQASANIDLGIFTYVPARRPRGHGLDEADLSVIPSLRGGGEAEAVFAGLAENGLGRRAGFHRHAWS